MSLITGGRRWPIFKFLISHCGLKCCNRISNTGCRDTVYIRHISLAVSLILRASMVQARVGADYDCNQLHIAM